MDTSLIGDRWPLYWTVVGVVALFVADAFFNWTIFVRRPRYGPSYRAPRFSLFGRVVRVAVGGFVLIALVQLGFREWRLRARLRAEAAAGGFVPITSQSEQAGSSPRPVKLPAGELLLSASTMRDGSTLVMTGAGMVERSGTWLHRLDAEGRPVPSFGVDGAVKLDVIVPGARTFLHDDRRQRIHVVGSVGGDEAQQLDIISLDESGDFDGKRLRLDVPRVHPQRGTATTGDVALALGEEGRLIVVGRANDPKPGTSRLQAFRLRGQVALDPDFGGELAQLPAGADGKVHIARGPNDELYVSTDDGRRAWVLRLTAQGRPDPSFGKHGVVELDGPGYSFMTMTPEGVVIGGIVAGYRFMMRRVRFDGSIDEGFAADLRKAPLKLRENELTHAAGAAFLSGALWVALYSFESDTGRTTTALARFSTTGALVGAPLWLDDEVPSLPAVKARALLPLGGDRLLLAVEGGPALPASAVRYEGRSDVYLCPISLSSFPDR